MFTDAQARDLAELLDKQKLHENLMRYCRGQDRKDLDLMKSSFWPEATDDHGGFVGNAHEFCELSYNGHKKSGHSSLHHCTNVLIDLDGDQARRESVFIFSMTHFKDRSLTQFMGGRYKDLCEKRGDEWRVLRRTCIFEWVQEFEGGRDFAGIFNFPPTAKLAAIYPEDPIYAAW